MSTLAKGTTLDEIERLTRRFAAARADLGDRLSALESDLRAVRRSHLRGLRAALARATDSRDALAGEISAHPELWRKPRTITIDGVRVGMAKGKGKIVWDDEARVVALIERHFPDGAEALVKTTRTPIRAALGGLTVGELKKIGCRVVESADEVVIKPQDSELDKLIGRLLEDTASLEEA